MINVKNEASQADELRHTGAWESILVFGVSVKISKSNENFLSTYSNYI